MQAHASTTDIITDPDISHLLPLPKASTNAVQYMVKTRVLTSPEQATLHYVYLVDIPQTDFPGEFTTAAAYAREKAPYDTATGLVIENPTALLQPFLDAPGLLTASADEIANDGNNLIILIGDEGKHEFIAFETATVLGGGQYRLNNVWRGLMDTPP